MTLLAGQLIRASELNSHIPLFGRASSDTSVTSSTTFVTATGLSVQVEANSSYILDGYLAYSAGATGDMKLSINTPTGSTGHFAFFGLASATTGGVGEIDAQRFAIPPVASDVVGGSDGGVQLCCIPNAYVATASTAGTIDVRFAQSTSSATSTVVKAGSWIRLHRVA